MHTLWKTFGSSGSSGLTNRSIMYWAKNDSLKDYEKIQKAQNRGRDGKRNRPGTDVPMGAPYHRSRYPFLRRLCDRGGRTPGPPPDAPLKGFRPHTPRGDRPGHAAPGT